MKPATEILQSAIELLTTSLHHTPRTEPQIIADTYTAINDIRELLARSSEPVARVIECGNAYAKVKLSGDAWGSTKVGDVFYLHQQTRSAQPLTEEADVELCDCGKPWGRPHNCPYGHSTASPEKAA